jgi:hypothetical protein
MEIVEHIERVCKALDQVIAASGLDYQAVLQCLASSTAAVLSGKMIEVYNLSAATEQVLTIYGDLVREITRERIRQHDEGR